jgi:predicted dehydrogenase
MFHLKAIEEVDEISVVSVADIDQKRMEEVRKKSGAVRGYIDPQELLLDRDVDAVAVNNPPKFHEETVLESLDAGKHVICEKPLAQNVEGCIRIKKRQDGSGFLVIPVHNYAFTPCLALAQDIIQSGEIGEILKVRLSFENNLWSYGAKTDFRMQDSFSIVEDMLPHILSIIKAIAGPIDTVTDVKGWKKRYKVIDNLSLILEAKDGLSVEGIMNWTSFIPAYKVNISGESGRLDMDLMKFPYRVVVETSKRKKKIDEKGLSQYLDLARLRHPAWAAQYRHFIKTVEGSEAPLFKVKDEIGMLQIMGEIVEALSEIDIS